MLHVQAEVPNGNAFFERYIEPGRLRGAKFQTEHGSGLRMCTGQVKFLCEQLGIECPAADSTAGFQLLSQFFTQPYNRCIRVSGVWRVPGNPYLALDPPEKAVLGTLSVW